MARHVELVKNQTRELVENYGPLGVMWFDGDWEEPWTAAYGDELYDYLKGIQPSLIINNRVSRGRLSTNADGSPAGKGDFDTPEQHVGDFDRGQPWESCITLGQNWNWKQDEKIKSLKTCIQTLLYSVGGDGNLLLNVGPMPTGEIELRQASRLREIGAWLAKYGGGVYGSRGGPFISWTGRASVRSCCQASTRRLSAIARFLAARPKSLRRPATSPWISPESTATRSLRSSN
jgi:alpha-L-fucosidase